MLCGSARYAVAALLADQNDDVKVVAIVALGKMGEYGELHARQTEQSQRINVAPNETHINNA